eukprot:5754640-Alexandrium_andersonii.AAC.1
MLPTHQGTARARFQSCRRAATKATRRTGLAHGSSCAESARNGPRRQREQQPSWPAPAPDPRDGGGQKIGRVCRGRNQTD